MAYKLGQGKIWRHLLQPISPCIGLENQVIFSPETTKYETIQTTNRKIPNRNHLSPHFIPPYRLQRKKDIWQNR